MRKKSILLAGLFLAASCANQSLVGPNGAAQADPCDSSGAGPPPQDGCGLVCRARLPITMVDDVPVTTVWVDDRPAHLIVDTGASMTSLAPAETQALGLGPPKVLPGEVFGIGGAQPRASVVAHKIALGGVSFTDRPVELVAMKRAPGVTLPDGGLGNDIMSQFEVDLDMPHNVVTLYQGRPCEGGLPGWRTIDAAVPFASTVRRGHHVAVAATIDGHPVTAMIDSGAADTVVGTRAALEIGVPPAELADDLPAQLFGVGPDTVAGHMHQVGRLDVGGQTLTGVETQIAPLPFRQPEIVLGHDYLATHKVWISNATGQVFFSHTW